MYASLGSPSAADMAKPCGERSRRNPVTGDCYCDAGYDWKSEDSNDCVLVDVRSPCTWEGQRRSPLDRACTCPPGMRLDESPLGRGCIQGGWFPGCVDVHGARIPGCLFGQPVVPLAMAAGVGAAVGLTLALALRAAFR